AAPTTRITRRFSKTIAVTYVGMSLFGFAFLVTGLRILLLGITSGSLLAVQFCALPLGLVFGFVYVMRALHQRRNWARQVALSLWLLCLIWSSYLIARNGLHPEPAEGPFRYTNEDQLAGA